MIVIPSAGEGSNIPRLMASLEIRTEDPSLTLGMTPRNTYRFSTRNDGTLDPPPAVTFNSAAVESRVRYPSMYSP